jgi:two-component system, NtrC family, sensor kinase
MARTTIKRRLTVSFSIAILIPSLTTAFVGVMMLRQQVYLQAQQRVNSDLEAGKEIYGGYLERLKDSLRIHATRRLIFGALERRADVSVGVDVGLAEEMKRVRVAERLDVLTLLDASGRVRHRTRNPALFGDDQAWCPLVAKVLREHAPASATVIVAREELLKESEELARQATMEVTPTPMSRPGPPARLTSGMMLKGAAPVFTVEGRFVGVLVGAVMLNRSTEIVDKISKTVFRNEVYRGAEVGTATVFQNDTRVSTNVRAADGSRAITTRASAEVAETVLGRGAVFSSRAFVVRDWYIAAYAPIRDIGGTTIGMLYVGTLERPYLDSLNRHLGVLLGIMLLGMGLVGMVAVVVAGRLSRPVRRIADAARRLAGGDFSVRVRSESSEEIADLAEGFNRMTEELARAQQELQAWGLNLERKVEERTAELKAVQTHMARAERLAAIGKLAAGVAHEINNPLTGVLTNANLMLADLPPEDPRRDDLQSIVNETLRCRTIVKGLLDFARQTKPQKQLVDIAQVVENVLGLVRNQASSHNIAIESDLARGMPLVMADRDQLCQVVLNVVLNAAEAMPNGGSLRLSSQTTDAGKQVVLEIKDNGPGIPPEIRDRIFEPFFTTKKTGTGLGLSIAYGILEQHGGTLQVQSPPEGGTTVLITLPADTAAER